MQQMVEDFEQDLAKTGSKDEIVLYEDIRGFLQTNLGGRVDLEAVFSIIDSITNWAVDRVGPAALYHTLRLVPNAGMRKLPPLGKPP